MDKGVTGLFIAMTIFILLLFSQNLSALMPPHINSSIPENGGILLGDTVRFYGYSLGYGDYEQLRVVDLTNDSTVETESDLICASEGEGHNPGCVQFKCILSITIKAIISTHKYEISFEKSNIGVDHLVFHFFGSAEDIGMDNDLDGITGKQGDCNDNDPDIFPGAIEVCSDNVDRDCDGNHSVCCETNNNGGGGIGGCSIHTWRY